MWAIKVLLYKQQNDAAKEAIHALEALQSVVRSGVSYWDYYQKMIDARIVADRFLREYPKHPAALYISSAIYYYESARDLWGLYIAYGKSESVDLSSSWNAASESIERARSKLKLRL